MDPADLRETVIPRLLHAKVERITLTGGEPLIHPGLLQICKDAVSAGLSVGICTNGTGVTDELVSQLKGLKKVHINLSLDGFSSESHGRFRGCAKSFEETMLAARRFGAAGLLHGVLSTPNALASPGEYSELATFARDSGADYLLMNPLSAFGRGVHSKQRLAADAELMKRIRAAVEGSAEGNLEVVAIRFPNIDAPLSPCIAGQIIYVFVDGAVAVCPYLVFAARTPESRYPASEFIIGNILKQEIAEALDAYRFEERYKVGTNKTCTSCELSKNCGKGCPAAVIAAGGLIGDRDTESCPIP